MISTILGMVLAIAKAIPIVDSWIQQLVAAYTASAIDAMKRENIDALRKALQGHDQRSLEIALGNPNPGGLSGDPGTIVVSSIPGVHNTP